MEAPPTTDVFGTDGHTYFCLAWQQATEAIALLGRKNQLHDDEC
jgi:hypothetical protein